LLLGVREDIAHRGACFFGAAGRLDTADEEADGLGQAGGAASGHGDVRWSEGEAEPREGRVRAGALERDEQRSKQFDQLVALLGVETSKEPVLGGDVSRGNPLEEVEPLPGESDETVAPVGGVHVSGYESSLNEMIDTGADGAGAEVELSHQLPLRDAVGSAKTAEGDEGVELGGVEAVLVERGFQFGVDRAGEPGEARDDRHGGEVEIGPCLSPPGEEAVD
jgi:hypothetical protein